MEAMVLHTSVVKGVMQSGSWYIYGNTCTMNQGKQDWIPFRGIESCQRQSVGANTDKHRYGGQTAVWSTSIASAGEMSHSCFFWLTWRPNTKIPNRSDRGAVAVPCDLEEILPSAKIIRSVNQVVEIIPPAKTIPCTTHHWIVRKAWNQNRVLWRGDPLLDSRWSTEEYSAHYSSSTRTDARHSHYWRSDSIKVDIAEGSNSDNVSHLHIWLMPDGWHSK